jgi:hypothetical protein
VGREFFGASRSRILSEARRDLRLRGGNSDRDRCDRRDLLACMEGAPQLTRLLCQFADYLMRAALWCWHLWFCAHKELIRAVRNELSGQECLRCRKFFPFTHCVRRMERSRELYVKQSIQFAADLSRYERGLRPMPTWIAEIESIGKGGTNG